ncbi:MAG: hypothetical protein ACR2QW_02180 [bacterium]
MTDRIRGLIKLHGALSTNLLEQELLLTWKQSDADLPAVLLATEIFKECFEPMDNLS